MVTDLKCGNEDSLSADTKHRNLPEFHPHSRLSTDFDLMNVIGIGTVYRARSHLDDIFYAIKRSRRRFHGTEDKNKMMHEVIIILNSEF